MPRLLLMAILLTSLFPTASAAQQPKKYNVLFLFSDDQRADTIAALGNPHIKTPHLDRLVRCGTAFTRAYCMGSQQGAVCVPSRAMLLTGRTLFKVSTNLAGQTTWPEMFARAGYATFLSGKWHNGQPAATRCFMLGKSVFFGGMGNPFSLPVADLGAGKKMLESRKTTKHSVEQFADEAIAFLKNHKADQPFLAYVAFNLPHDPRVAPKKYHEPYDAAKPPLPPNFLPQHPFDNGEMAVRDEQLAPWPRTPDVVRQHLADYYAAVTFLDEQVGRILDALQATGQYENTIIVFASDHGLAIGSHGLFGKQNLYNHSMNTPVIMAGPGIPKDKRSAALVYLLDLYPTLGALAGVRAPEGSEGKSLTPVLAGTAAGVRDDVVLAYRDVQRSIVGERWQLIRYTKINRTQLFDLQNDPHEIKDLAAAPEQAARVKEMMAVLERRQRELGDTLALTAAQPADPAWSPPKTKKAKQP